MGEIKGSLLTIVAAVVTFGIVSGGLFVAFDQLQEKVSGQVTSSVTYTKPESQSISIMNENLLSY